MIKINGERHNESWRLLSAHRKQLDVIVEAFLYLKATGPTHVSARDLPSPDGVHMTQNSAGRSRQMVRN
ncbi:MAG: hypothetical protein OEV99_01455 [Nitrospira sp.]|nr:hypothetical protein [Nitrospira sp.]MDH4368481.1 hypothetical protein [Nitrospira sp.]MDH5346363.1 hypothetical protein [Nitrospira sp.]MDH5496127.1 hypothetical protein [Nitrospira sp.]MDH5725459.1 hypothetical protein [Nitrospira sp.]